MKVVKGSKLTKKAAPYYVELSNSYATLDKFLSEPSPPSKDRSTFDLENRSIFKVKAAARRKSKTAAYIAAMNDAGIIDLHINQAEDERTEMAKKTARSSRHSDKTSV